MSSRIGISVRQGLKKRNFAMKFGRLRRAILSQGKIYPETRLLYTYRLYKDMDMDNVS